LIDREKAAEKEKREREEKHKAMIDDIRRKQEEFKAKNNMPSS
jgi:hypothetical protein